MTDDDLQSALHAYARERAEKLAAPDKKQLRFNDIVRVARSHYAAAPFAGVRELVESCDKESPLYQKGAPMWAVLEAQYAWMATCTHLHPPCTHRARLPATCI